MQRKVKRTIIFSSVCCTAFLWWACTTSNYYTHTVKWRTESLSIIAGWYTGDLKNWKAISEENPEVNPSPIPAGTKIQIPENLVKNRTPLTREYVDSFYERPRREQSPKELPQIRDERLDYFGPKRFPRK